MKNKISLFLAFLGSSVAVVPAAAQDIENMSEQAELVMHYMQEQEGESRFVLLDRQTSYLHLVDGNEVQSFPALVGRSSGDNEPVSSDSTRSGIWTMPDPIVYATPSPLYGQYAIPFACERISSTQQVCDSIHRVINVRGQDRFWAIEYGNVEQRKLSNGCINVPEPAMEEIFNFVTTPNENGQRPLYVATNENPSFQATSEFFNISQETVLSFREARGETLENIVSIAPDNSENVFNIPSLDN